MAITATHDLNGARIAGAYIRLASATWKKVEDERGRRLKGTAQFAVHANADEEIPLAYVDLPDIAYVAGADLAALAYAELKSLYPDAEDA